MYVDYYLDKVVGGRMNKGQWRFAFKINFKWVQL